MREAIEHRERSRLSRLLLMLAIAAGLLIMHGDLVATSAATAGGGTVAVASPTTEHGIRTARSAGPLARSAIAESHSVGAMRCAGMLTGAELLLLIPDTRTTTVSRPGWAATVIRPRPHPTRWGRARPEVLLT